MAKSKRTKATDVSDIVRRLVYERDTFEGYPCCVTCGKPGKHTMSHYIKRSQGGLGIAKNLINQCFDCHEKMERGKERDDLLRQTKEYLQSVYPDWDEKYLVYRRDENIE